MLCEVCEQEEATLTLIPVGEGMPQSIGGACFARFGLETAKAVLPAEEIAQILGPMFVSATPGPSAKARAARKSETPPAETTEQAPGPQAPAPPAEESAAAQDA